MYIKVVYKNGFNRATGNYPFTEAGMEMLEDRTGISKSGLSDIIKNALMLDVNEVRIPNVPYDARLYIMNGPAPKAMEGYVIRRRLGAMPRKIA